MGGKRTGALTPKAAIRWECAGRYVSANPYTARRMKYLVFVPDGCADVALAELGGRTPLEAARMPRLADLARRGEVGRAAVIPPGLPPGSDVGNMAILGFDPARYHTGRAPIEAAAMGVELGPDEVAYRCNLVTLSDDEPPVMVDFAAGHPTNEQSHAIVAALDAALGAGRDGVRFYPGRRVSPSLSRAACVVRRGVHAAPRPHRRVRGVPDRRRVAAAARADGRVARPSCATPRDGRQQCDPDLVVGAGSEAGAPVVRGDVRGRGTDVVGRRPRAGSRGADRHRGRRRARRDRGFRQRLRRPSATRASGRSTTATCSCCMSRRPTRPGTRAWPTSRSTRSSGGTPTSSVRSSTRSTPPATQYRILLMPDHATPCDIKTHSADPVPYLLFDSERAGPGGVYTEPATAACPAGAGSHTHGAAAREIAGAVAGRTLQESSVGPSVGSMVCRVSGVAADPVAQGVR